MELHPYLLHSLGRTFPTQRVSTLHHRRMAFLLVNHVDERSVLAVLLVVGDAEGGGSKGEEKGRVRRSVDAW